MAGIAFDRPGIDLRRAEGVENDDRQREVKEGVRQQRRGEERHVATPPVARYAGVRRCRRAHGVARPRAPNRLAPTRIAETTNNTGMMSVAPSGQLSARP